jgi:hypothetical protein
MVEEERDSVGGRQRSQYVRVLEDLAQAGDRQDREPQTHDWPEQRRQRARAKALDAEPATRTATATGTTRECRLGVATSKPSTADRTEIAGVIIPSP